jgi:hypothetical protein
MAARYGELNVRASAHYHPPASVPPSRKASVARPLERFDEHRAIPTTIKFNPMTYDRRKSEARRVSVSNIGPLSEAAEAEDHDSRRGFLQTLSEKFEFNLQRRQGGRVEDV